MQHEKISVACFSDCQVATPPKATQDVEMARKLWDVSAMMVNLQTVSYTHLDVYKRQPELYSSQDLLFLVKIG